LKIEVFQDTFSKRECTRFMLYVLPQYILNDDFVQKGSQEHCTGPAIGKGVGRLHSSRCCHIETGQSILEHWLKGCVWIPTSPTTKHIAQAALNADHLPRREWVTMSNLKSIALHISGRTFRSHDIDARNEFNDSENKKEPQDTQK